MMPAELTVKIEDSSTSARLPRASTRPYARLTATAVATVSALVGGLAAAWFYRKTLARLRFAEATQHNPNFGRPEHPQNGGASTDGPVER